MNRIAAIVLLVAVLLAPGLSRAAAECSDPPPAREVARPWSFSATVYQYFLPDEGDFPLLISTADRGRLHLEARYNYEERDTGSLFAGWTYCGGNSLNWELTPMLGAVFGAKQGVAPGLEAAVAYGFLDFYIEAEYVYDTEVREDSFTYAWSELGFTFVEWLRVGLVGQRTRLYESKRDIQRGLFAEVSLFDRFSLGLFAFNPDDSDTRFTILSFGADF
jgi:hypothetical protein